MTKTAQQTEYEILWRDHSAPLIYPHLYVKNGEFYENTRKYEHQFKDDFHPAEKVERLRELAKERA